MYVAHEDKVYYFHPQEHTEELFLTVHPTKDSTLEPDEQARVIAKMLNDD